MKSFTFDEQSVDRIATSVRWVEGQTVRQARRENPTTLGSSYGNLLHVQVQGTVAENAFGTGLIYEGAAGSETPGTEEVHFVNKSGRDLAANDDVWLCWPRIAGDHSGEAQAYWYSLATGTAGAAAVGSDYGSSMEVDIATPTDTTQTVNQEFTLSKVGTELVDPTISIVNGRMEFTQTGLYAFSYYCNIDAGTPLPDGLTPDARRWNSVFLETGAAVYFDQPDLPGGYTMGFQEQSLMWINSFTGRPSPSGGLETPWKFPPTNLSAAGLYMVDVTGPNSQVALVGRFSIPAYTSGNMFFRANVHVIRF